MKSMIMCVLLREYEEKALEDYLVGSKTQSHHLQ